MEDLSAVIKALQNIHDNQAAYIAIEDAKDKAEAELKAVQSALESTKRELQSATSGLTQAQTEIKRNYEVDINNASTKLKDLQKLIADGEAKFTQLDAKVREKQEAFTSITSALNVLKNRIEGKAA